MKWLRTAWGWTAWDGVHRWTVRGPIFGKRMFWVYKDTDRQCHGTAECPVPFPSVAVAKKFCESHSL